MRNIRITSLPTDRSVASSDCQICTRRRIRCDRSLPRCKKCTLRNYSCPGYQSPLKWNQGIASRGRWKGKHAPCDDSFSTERQLSQQDDCDGWSTMPDQSAAMHFPSEVLSKRASADMLSSVLVEHFRSEVSPRLTWLDSPDNPWRTLVAPLANTNKCVSMTMLYLAAAHLASRSSLVSVDHGASFQLRHELRQHALTALTSGIRLALSDQKATEMISVGLLAGTLIFCHAEMLIPNSDEWKLHLRGCQAISNRDSLITNRVPAKPSIWHFLGMEVEYLEAFDDLSTFGDLDSRKWRSVQPEGMLQRSLFWSFTSVLRDITEYERSRYANKRVDCSSQVEHRAWQNRLTNAYEAVYTDVRKQMSAVEGLDAVFAAVVRAHYFAGMIYLEQAIAFSHDQISHRLFLIQNLIKNIDLARKAVIFDHDLFWPLFILGTECSESESRQAQLTACITECISTTGFWCNKAALDFLQTYWARPAADKPLSWIEYARQNNHMLTPFLIF